MKRDGKTVLIATNAIDEALALGDSFGIIHAGKMLPLVGADGAAVSEATITNAFEGIRL